MIICFFGRVVCFLNIVVIYENLELVKIIFVRTRILFRYAHRIVRIILGVVVTKIGLW